MKASAEIQLFCTYHSKKRVFKSKVPGHVSLYGCGPTVYNLIHVGNARAFLVQDLLVRVFEQAGYRVAYARNYTDIDDKIIKAAAEESLSAAELAAKYVEQFDEDMESLGSKEPTYRPKVSETMSEIVAMIAELIKKNHAYIANTPWGSDVYFRVSSFKKYGALSKRPIDDLLNQSRIEPGEAKESPVDFALWKAAKEGEPSWESPWGRGRPGWHIECSAMIDKLFPERLDIHMGGSDLVFPHHENEIAQSEACSHHHPLAEYWVHNGMVQIGQVKMSKSLGNFLTLRDFLRVFGAETLRLLVYQAHYRSPVDFSRDSLVRTEALVEKLYHYKKLATTMAGAPHFKNMEEAAESAPFLTEVWASLRDDLNSAKALGIILKEARMMQKENDPKSWSKWLGSLYVLNQVYGVLEKDPDRAIEEIRHRRIERSGLTAEACQEIEDKLALRMRLRAEKNFEEGDRIRKELEASGVIVMDGVEASTWDLK